MTAQKNDIAVSVRNVHKEFILPQSKNSSFKQTFVNIVKRNNKVTQKVLNGVSFDVKKGDFFGIVGRNGSGKSTLLKMLAGVYVPTSGEIELNGALTPFIELGVGFNPELSGRDNVYLNGALLGFNRDQMDAMYDEIVEFSELEPFMGQKLKNYSSGMQVRLAFSIAIKAKNDILIFDEVLAVGDEAFQRKCMDVFERYKAKKQTVIFVTHDMDAVKSFCNRAILVSEGNIVMEGDPRKVAAAYSELNQEEIDKSIQKENERNLGESKIVAELLDGVNNTEPRQNYIVGEEMLVKVSWKDLGPLESIGVNIIKESGEHITGYNTRFSKVSSWKKNQLVSLKLNLDIAPGKYHILVEAYEKEGVVKDALVDGPSFTISSQKDRREWSGLFELKHEWIDS